MLCEVVFLQQRPPPMPLRKYKYQALHEHMNGSHEHTNGSHEHNNGSHEHPPSLSRATPVALTSTPTNRLAQASTPAPATNTGWRKPAPRLQPHKRLAQASTPASATNTAVQARVAP